MVASVDDAIFDLLTSRGTLEEHLGVLLATPDEAIPKIVAALMECARGAGPDRWWNGAPALVEALGRAQDEGATRALLTVLNTDSRIVEWDRIRAHAATAIGELGDPQLVGELAAAADRPHAPAFAIDDAIAALGGTSTQNPRAIIQRGERFSPVDGDAYLASYSSIASDWPPDMRRWFYFTWARNIRAYKGLGAALPYYAASLAADPDPLAAGWQEAFPKIAPSAHAAAELASRYPLPADPVAATRDISDVVAALKDPDEYQRFRAVEALGQLRDATAVPALIEALADSSYGVRLRAARALAALGDRRAVGPLIAATADPRPVVVRNAVDALGVLRDPVARARLSELLAYRYVASADPDFDPEFTDIDEVSQQVRDAARAAIARLSSETS